MPIKSFFNQSIESCTVTVGDHWGSEKGEGNSGVEEGSLAPTRDKCGRAFEPRASKGDFQVSKGWFNTQTERGMVEGGMGELIKNSYHP
jgi:hypothetical protein